MDDHPAQYKLMLDYLLLVILLLFIIKSGVTTFWPSGKVL